MMNNEYNYLKTKIKIHRFFMEMAEQWKTLTGHYPSHNEFSLGLNHILGYSVLSECVSTQEISEADIRNIAHEIAVLELNEGIGLELLKAGYNLGKSGIQTGLKKVAPYVLSAVMTAAPGIEKAAAEVGEQGVKTVLTTGAKEAAKEATKEFVDVTGSAVAKGATKEVVKRAGKEATKEVVDVAGSAVAKGATKEVVDVAGSVAAKGAKEVIDAGIKQTAKETAKELATKKTAEEAAKLASEAATKKVAAETAKKAAETVGKVKAPDVTPNKEINVIPRIIPTRSPSGGGSGGGGKGEPIGRGRDGTPGTTIVQQPQQQSPDIMGDLSREDQEFAPTEVLHSVSKIPHFDAFTRRWFTQPTSMNESKLSPKESLQRKLSKQRYKVSYVQDGKKVEVFASSLRGVRRVVYGRKQYRVHNSTGSDVTGYFKKLLGE